MNDNIQIEILEDGTIKTTTDKVSAPNHANAEQFLLNMARDAGGRVTRTRRGAAVTKQTVNQKQNQ